MCFFRHCTRNYIHTQRFAHCDGVQEQELSSMVELENLRKSVGKENFHLLEPCFVNSDSDWVVHEHEEPDLFQRAPAPVNDKKNEPEMQDINPVCRQVARIPRFRSRFLILNIINIQPFYKGNMLNLLRRLIQWIVQ